VEVTSVLFPLPPFPNSSISSAIKGVEPCSYQLEMIKHQIHTKKMMEYYYTFYKKNDGIHTKKMMKKMINHASF
jgi:hypothetical protein